MDRSTQSRFVVAAVTLGLLSLAAAPAQGAFPGKPGSIAFQRGPDIYSMPATGGLGTPLVARPGDMDFQPSYSADGQRLAWEGFVMGFNFDALITSSSGGPFSNLSMDPADEFDPTISPDGKTVAFAKQIAGQFEIVTVPSGGGPVTNLTQSPEDEFDPAYSPNGKRIAFARYAGDGEIFEMPAKGGTPVNLTNNDVTETEPDYSPDGRRIIFMRSIALVEDIVTMNANGSAQTNVTNTPATEESSPVFSPDGSRIAFARDTNADGLVDEIFSAVPNGAGLVNLTAGSGAMDSDNQPSWQPIPVKCGGKRSNLVGTGGRDTLNGTPGKDVISGLGGRDTLKGMAGNDLLCGGGAKDKLLGGKGNDRTLGGKGDDVCSGGPGRRDVAKSC